MDKNLAEIIDLLLKIQEKTKFAVFFDFSGHIDKFTIYIAESKDNYCNRLFSEHSRLYVVDGVINCATLEFTLLLLKEFCDKHNINLGENNNG